MSAGDCVSHEVSQASPRTLHPPTRFPECHIRGEFEIRDAVHRIGAHCRLEAVHYLNSIIASGCCMVCWIFNVCQSVFCFLRGWLWGVGGWDYEGVRHSGCEPRSLYRLSCLSGHNKASTHATCHMRRFLAGCHSHWLPLINSQGLSAGRSRVDSWIRRLGHAPMRACVVVGMGWGGLGACGPLAVFARKTSGLHVHMPTVWLCSMQLCSTSNVWIPWEKKDQITPTPSKLSSNYMSQPPILVSCFSLVHVCFYIFL